MNTNLSTSQKKVIGVLAGVLVVGLFGCTQYAGAKRYGADSEAGIKAAWNDNKQVLGQYTVKVQEAAQIPDMAKDDLTEVMTKALDARYGEGGSQAVFSMIKESYPGAIDPALYRNIQDIITSGRTDFTNNQTKLLDRKRDYEASLNYMWKGTWLHIAGYPKINLDDYNVVTSARAETAFKNGVDEPIKLQ